MHIHINKFSRLIIASTLVLSSSFLLIKSNNSSVQAQTNINSAQWQQFTVREGGFSIFLPRKPKETIEPVGMGAGAGTLHNFFVELQNSTYGISYADFPNISGDLNAQQINDLLDSVRDGVVGKGKLLKERSITINGYVGKEIEFVDVDKLNYKTRIYWVKQRLYQQIVVSPNPRLILAQDTNKFLDSFKLLAISAQQGKPTLIASVNNELATLAQTSKEQLQRGDFKAALTTLQQALAIARRNNDKPSIGTLLNNIGEAYRSQSNYVQALDFYQQALAITKELKDRAEEGIVITNISSIYESQGNYSQALKFAEQGLAIHKEVGNRALAGTTLNNIGIIYQSRGEYDRALSSLQEALAIHKETKNITGIGTTLNNIGLIYYGRSQYPQALDSFQQAVKISIAGW